MLVALGLLITYGLYESGALKGIAEKFGGTTAEQWFVKPEVPEEVVPPVEEEVKEKVEEKKPEAPPACPTEGFTAPPLKLTIVDALNPKQGVSGIRVEALKPDEKPWDPYRQVLDYGDSDSDGVVTFDGGVLKIHRKYAFAIRGDTTVYDKLVELKTPCVPEGWAERPYSFDDRIMVYRVGSFDDISDDADNILTCTDSGYSVLNVTANTGIQQVSFDITIKIPDTDAGKAIKMPVVVLRSPEGFELEPGDILHVYFIRKTGSDLGIPPSDLVGYITGGTPIEITTRTQEIEDKEVINYMTSADSAVYTVLVQYDADNIDPSDDKLQIVLDDLGEYQGKDIVTRSTKATPQTLTIQWCE